MSIKPKEFWIQPGSYGEADYIWLQCMPLNDYFKANHTTHVIEFSAYEKLQNQNRIMREALLFYSNIDNWQYSTYDIHAHIINDDLGSVTKYKNTEFGGAKARTALTHCDYPSCAKNPPPLK